MTPKAQTLFKVLLNSYHRGPLEEILTYLPEEEREALQKIATQSKDLSVMASDPEEQFTHIHYSWFKPFIAAQDKQAMPLYLSVLPQKHAIRLAEILECPLNEEAVNPFLKAFLQKQIQKALIPRELNPMSYLSPNRFNPLAYCSKSELLTLIDFLGIYDLAEAIRHIVDKRYIRHVYSCLSIKKQEFLRPILYQRERLIMTRMDLDQWDGDCHKLKQRLHKRGILRLGGALSEQSADLIWHISHILDTGRGTLLATGIQKDKAPGVVAALAQQLINLMNFLKTKTSA